MLAVEKNFWFLGNNLKGSGYQGQKGALVTPLLVLILGGKIFIMILMNKLDKAEKIAVAEKIMDFGNLVFIGLVITQIVPEIKLKILPTITGFVIISLSYLLAINLMKGGKK